MDTTVSVIMPTYNRGHIIDRSIMSVLAQTHKEFELIVVDDGSTDGTETIVSNHNDDRIHYIKLAENRGACYARNVGINSAKGKYVAFLDSDNVWNDEYLEKRFMCLKNNHELGGVFGSTTIVGDDGCNRFPSDEICEKLNGYSSNEQFIEEMLYGNIIDTNTIVLRRKAIYAIDGFNESLKRLQDWDYFFRLLLYSQYNIRFSDDCLVINYVLSDSLGKNNREYWKSLCFFIKEYKQEYIKRNLFYEGFCHHLTNQFMGATRQDIENYLDILDRKDKDEVIVCLREMIIDKNIMLAELWTKTARTTKIKDLQTKWLELKQDGVSLDNVIYEMGNENIVIYGYGVLGKLLLNELKDGRCNVLGIIDRKLNMTDIDGIPVIKPVDDYGDADAVIVTAISDFDDIRKEYENNIKFISLEEVIDFHKKNKKWRT